MRDADDRLRAAGIRAVGINPAPAERHADYAARLRLPFPLLSDGDLSVSRAYGAVRPDGRAIARSVVLVGADGVVRFARHGAPSLDLVLARQEEP